MTPKEEKSKLSVEWLREQMAYEPDTGSFLWKVKKQGRRVGRVLGTTVWPGYQVIKVEGVVFYAHRLAWFYVHGEWPSNHIDHIDDDKANNAIDNLRIATPAQNAARRKTTRKLAPSRGVFPHGSGYVARIHFAGKRHYLGYFPTKQAAQKAYEAKAKEVHGEFAFKEDPDTRGDWFNTLHCEVCGENKNPNEHLLLLGRIGRPLGKLCKNCMGIVGACDAKPEILRKMAGYLELAFSDDDDPESDNP